MVKLVDYQDTVCKETWKVFNEMADTFKSRKLKVSFFNSTPQGGGGKLFFFLVSISLIGFLI
jgi:hypothetical protein